ncbi:hypothetical protein ACHHYP_05694 [Achlya hypogyna]|uniref:Ankyrin repeat protein n=1 Tax=Achlya hypogyna TaxID=1202772 RepID=A0A1V9YXH8_ACHHY|nr:hypothetical protein ACHHYP_05694 [Achlya hypogyna]
MYPNHQKACACMPARFTLCTYLRRYPTAFLHPHALFLSSDHDKDPALPLHLSIIDGNLAHVTQWVMCGPDLCTSQTLELAAAAAEADILRLLVHRFPERMTLKAMDLVAMAGDLATLRWLHDAGFGCTTAAMDGAAMNGHEDVVRFLHEARSEGCTVTAVNAAVARGHASIAEFLLTHRTEGIMPPGCSETSLYFQPPHCPAVTYCVEGRDYIRALDVVYERTSVTVQPPALHSIVQRCGLPALEHFLARGYLHVSKATLEAAVRRRDVAMVRFVLEHIEPGSFRIPLATSSVPDAEISGSSLNSSGSDGDGMDDERHQSHLMDLAAFYGDLDVIKLLYQRGCRSCHGARAVQWASYGGHVRVLDWLLGTQRDACFNTTVNFLYLAFPLAARQGHLNVVRWFCEVYGLRPSAAALASAACAGHADVVKYLLDGSGAVDLNVGASDVQAYKHPIHVNLPRPDMYPFSVCHRSEFVRGAAVMWAAANGHVAVLRLLQNVPTTSQAMDLAAKNGHLDAVRYLHENRAEGCSQLAFSHAMAEDCMEVVEYLFTHNCCRDPDPIDVPSMYLHAATNGRLELFALVRAAYPLDLAVDLPSLTREQMVENAACRGHLRLLSLLHEVHGFAHTQHAANVAARAGHDKVVAYLSTWGPPVPTTLQHPHHR